MEILVRIFFSPRLSIWGCFPFFKYLNARGGSDDVVIYYRLSGTHSYSFREINYLKKKRKISPSANQFCQRGPAQFSIFLANVFRLTFRAKGDEKNRQIVRNPPLNNFDTRGVCSFTWPWRNQKLLLFLLLTATTTTRTTSASMGGVSHRPKSAFAWFSFLSHATSQETSEEPKVYIFPLLLSSCKLCTEGPGLFKKIKK